MNSIKSSVLLTCLVTQMNSYAAPQFSGGIWWVYQDAAADNLSGEFADPAFIFYADNDDSTSPWGYSGEMRVGRGAFTNSESNSSGDNTIVHKAWVSYQLENGPLLTVGKSQVPFGWKTHNNWPGDMLQGGYGDQMDVGIKASGIFDSFSYDAAFYTQDDWGSTSTDTSDDGGHWGSAVDGSETYRKEDTLVLNVDWHASEHHTFGISAQAGKLVDLSEFVASGEKSLDDDHQAIDLHYVYNRDAVTFKYRYVDVSRDFRGLETCVARGAAPDFGVEACPNEEVKNERHAIYLGYGLNDWSFYLDATAASTSTASNTSGDVYAFSPGVSYKYGPGWVYLEYLWQDGFVDSFGDIGEGDFKSLYVTFDFYF